MTAESHLFSDAALVESSLPRSSFPSNCLHSLTIFQFFSIFFINSPTTRPPVLPPGAPSFILLPTCFSVQVTPQLLEFVGLGEFTHGLLFNLADPLPRQVQHIANFLECPGPVIIQAETQLEHSGFLFA